jgi:hypothetical protein
VKTGVGGGRDGGMTLKTAAAELATNTKDLHRQTVSYCRSAFDGEVRRIQILPKAGVSGLESFNEQKWTGILGWIGGERLECRSDQPIRAAGQGEPGF